MTQHSDPHFRPGRGGTRTVIGLLPEAERAREVWFGLYTERCEQARGQEVVPRIRHQQLEDLLATGTGTAGELLRMAVADARSRGICQIGRERFEHWAFLQILSEAQQRLIPPVNLAADSTDTCRHGVAYSDECQLCDEEM